ncbi:MAG: TIR domain-containing protein [Bacteroidota bacterium]
MTFENALNKVYNYLRENHGATNSVLVELIEGDTGLFEKIREHLIFNDLAEDKKGVGLVCLESDEPSDKVVKTKEKQQDFPESGSIEPGGKYYKIFISYGRKDAEELAKKIASDLSCLGHNVWIDKEQIKTGRSWEEQIEEAILSHTIFISLLTPYAVRRPDGVCLDEISMARFHNRKIVPVMVARCRPPLSIYRLDWVDFQEWTDDNSYKRSFERIIKALAEEANVEGSYADIFSKLKPLDFGVDISRMTKDFTGRQWLFDEFDSWIKQASSRIFLITGDPGIGKSAIMAQLASRHPQVMAFHFCISSLADSVNPDVFVRSIAAQLATQIKEYYEAIRQLNFEQLTRLDSGTLFRRLIADPLKNIHLDEQVVILVDALDESWNDANNNIVSVLHERIEDLPENVKIMVSSRKIPDIIDLLSKFRPFEIDPVFLENINDISDYLDKKFADELIADKISGSEQDIKNLKDLIIHKSEGNFLYIKQFIYGIETERIDINKPASFPDGLVGIYISFFDRIFNNYENYDDFRPLLEVIATLKEPFSAKELSPILQLSEFEISRRMEILAAFFPERKGGYSPYHKSVVDWLKGEAGTGRKYLLDMERGKKVVCEYLIKRYSWGDYDLYLLKHLPNHLIESQRYNELADLLLDFDFIIQKCRHNMVYDLIKDYHSAFTFLPDLRDSRLEELEYLKRVAEYTDQLILCPEKIQNKEIIIESFTPWSDQQVDCEIERIRMSPNRRDTLEIFLQFFHVQAHLLSLYGNLEGYVLQQAWNYADSGPFARYVDEYIEKCDHLKLLFIPAQRKEFNPFNPCKRILQEHTERVLGVFTNDGKYAVTGSNDSTLKLWDLRSGECLKTITPHVDYLRTLDATPDLNLVVTSGSRKETVIKLWNYKDLEPRGELKGHTGRINYIKITPDGRYVISGSSDNSAKVWDTKTRQCIADFHKHTDRVVCVDISIDGKTGVSGGFDNMIYVWDIPAKKCIREFGVIEDLGSALKLSINKDILYSCCGYDGRTVKSTIKIWDLKSGECIKTLYGHEYSVRSLETTHDGKFLVSASLDKTIKVWNLNTYDCVKTIEGHVGPIISLKITPDLKYLISGGGGHNDNTVRIWDIYKSKMPPEDTSYYRNFNHLHICQEGGFVVNSCRKIIQIRDLQNGRIKAELSGHKSHIKKLIVDKTGKRIISSSSDKSIRIWDLIKHECKAVLEGHTEGILDICLSGDRKKLVSCGLDRQLIEWDLEKNEKIRIFQGHDCSVIYNTWMDNDKYVISIGADNILKVWNMDTGICLNNISLPESITLEPLVDNKNHLFLGCTDGSVQYWDIHNPELLFSLKGHTGLISSLELVEEENLLFSGSPDCTIRQWDLTTKTCTRVFSGHSGEVVFIRKVPGYDKIVTASRDHTISVWDIQSGKCSAVLSTNLQINSLSSVQKNGSFAYGTMEGEFKIVQISGL